MIQKKMSFGKEGIIRDLFGIYWGYILVGKIPEKGGGRGGWKFKNFFCLDRWFRLEGTNDNI
jgi:hypothetical protein